MYKIAVIGDRESVLGFKALGLEVHFADEPTEARTILHALAKEEYAVIYLTEQLAAEMKTDIAAYTDNTVPAVILFPGKSGSLGIGMGRVHESVERAIGADILGED